MTEELISLYEQARVINSWFGFFTGMVATSFFIQTFGKCAE